MCGRTCVCLGVCVCQCACIQGMCVLVYKCDLCSSTRDTGVGRVAFFFKPWKQKVKATCSHPSPVDEAHWPNTNSSYCCCLWIFSLQFSRTHIWPQNTCSRSQMNMPAGGKGHSQRFVSKVWTLWPLDTAEPSGVLETGLLIGCKEWWQKVQHATLLHFLQLPFW